MFVVFTGDGKGKTTAALGQAVRVAGRGKRVLMIQFIKGPWKSGEDFVQLVSNTYQVTSNSEPQFELRKRGLGFVGILGDNLPREEHVAAARAALEEFKTELATKKWGLIILDEVNVAVSLGLITADEVLDAVKDLAPKQFVLFTGRDAPQAFIDRADLVTEMREVKHPFNNGKMAEAAVEF